MLEAAGVFFEIMKLLFGQRNLRVLLTLFVAQSVIVRCVRYDILVATLRLSHVFDVFFVKCGVSVTKPFASGNEIAMRQS